MNCKSASITGIVLIVVFFAVQFLVHGVMLQDIYMQNASLWRSHDEMQSLFGLMMIGEAIFAFFFAIIFASGYDASKAGLGQGIRFGLLMAFLIAPFSGLSWYVILPIPATLAVYWFLADFVTMIVLGAVAGLVYKQK